MGRESGDLEELLEALESQRKVGLWLSALLVYPTL